MAYTAAYTALFAFGDSLSDAGNDWIVDGHTDPRRAGSLLHVAWM